MTPDFLPKGQFPHKDGFDLPLVPLTNFSSRSALPLGLVLPFFTVYLMHSEECNFVPYPPTQSLPTLQELTIDGHFL